ncbi:MAG: hypothetical protein AMXMBFR59_30910 [Rhodanobacteraceae bacterium]
MTPRSNPTRRSLLPGVVALFIPASADASTGATVEGALLVVVAAGLAFWVAYATMAPFRNVMLRIPRNANRLVLFVLGAIALAFAVGSVLIGTTTIGAGTVIEAVEPQRFWQLIKLQLGAGCVLLVLGLLAGGRSR